MIQAQMFSDKEWEDLYQRIKSNQSSLTYERLADISNRSQLQILRVRLMKEPDHAAPLEYVTKKLMQQ